jgi:hypothetical protein
MGVHCLKVYILVVLRYTVVRCKWLAILDILRNGIETISLLVYSGQLGGLTK